MEQELARSEALLREAQRIAKVGSWELDLVSNQLSWSDEIFRIFEVDPASFAPSYEGFLACVHPDDRALVNETYGRSVREHEPYAILHRLRMQDGRIKHVQERGETFYDEALNPLRSLGTIQDITTQVMAAQTLARERALLQTIVDASPDHIFAKDAEHRFLFVNRAFAAGVSRTPSELVGHKDTDFWPRRECEGDPSVGLRGFHEDDGAAMRGDTIHIPREDVSFDGGVRVLETFKGPLRDPSGSIVGSYGYARDITDAERAQRALRESEQRLALIFNSTKDPVALVDVGADGRLTVSALNEAHVQLLSRLSGTALDRAELLGMERKDMLAGVVCPKEMARGDAMYRQAITTKQPVSYTIEIARAAGGLYFDATVTPVLDGAGKCTHVLWTARDITEQYEYSARIAKQLEEKEVLLREIHHRVKNNLQVVSSLLFLQQERAESAEAVASLRESSARVSAMALIHEKLYGADDLAGVDMHAYAGDLARTLLSSFGVTHERITLDIWGRVMQLQLDQATPYGLILNELVTNALKHAFPSGRSGRIQIGFAEFRGHYELTIGDDGIGAPADVLEAPRTSLGMRLVRRLLSQLGASIERLPQCGTVYRLRLQREPSR